MKRKVSFGLSIYIVAAAFAFLYAACGSDTVAPADPATTSEIPDIVFFNTGDPSPVFLFEGRATDNTRVEEVLVSFNNGSDWNTADIDSSPPNTIRNVEWSYLASETDVPAIMNTVLIRASDDNGNEVTSSPIPLKKEFSSSVGDLETMFSTAASGQVIGLSSGVDGAYGNGTTGPSIPIDVTLTIVGSGYGSTVTSGGLSFPAAASTATFIQSSVSSASIFSVDGDLTLKGMRLLGAVNAVRISDSAGPDPQLSIEEVVFDGQAAWAVHAEDDDAAVGVTILNSIVDASQASSSSGGGGLYLDNVNYTVTGSEFYLQSAVDAGAGVQVFGGTGSINDSIFEANSLAIWASGGEAVIESCNISGIIGTTNGILYSGSTVLSPEIRYSYISSNSGYGVKIAGQIPLIFLHNTITGNGSGGTDEGGVIIDYNFTNSNTAPVLGECNVYNVCQIGGRNSIFDNDPFDATVTATSVTYIPIDAEGNWWGLNKTVRALVDVLIQDGDIFTIPGPEDDPFGRAYLDFEPWDSTNNDPND